MNLASGAGNPTGPKLVCCEAWWPRSKKVGECLLKESLPEDDYVNIVAIVTHFKNFKPKEVFS